MNRCYSRWFVALLLILVVLAPYHRLITGRAIPIPDDIFVSDLADGEFPARVEAGRIAREGELPVWTSRLLTGLPLTIDPLSVTLFAVLPPALALGVLLGLLLSVAALGMYVLGRLLGASRSGAFVSGFAFAWSGFFVCQLRHLGIIETVAFFPWAIYCLEQASAGGALDAATARAIPLRRRLLWLVAFGGFFGMQCLAAFPQSAYISALFYAALVASRAIWLLDFGHRLPWRKRIAPVTALAVGAFVAVVAGALVGMMELLPLHELGALSDRHAGGTYEWATYFKYYVPNFFTFFVPYINGDISDLTYKGRSIFWEDYGYVGLVTILCAFVAVAFLRHSSTEKGELSLSRMRLKENRFAVLFWACTALVAYGLILGSATPLYRLAFDYVPGLKTFRFPTRFLFVVEFALTLLGGLGLTYFQAFLARRVPNSRRFIVPSLVGVVLACITVADLVVYNRRQNPLMDSKPWLALPVSASLIQKSSHSGRVYSPNAKKMHKNAFYAACGWCDLAPYYLQREFLQPNSNLLHGLSTLNAYSGISPTWALELIGDHCHLGFLGELGELYPAMPSTYYDWLEALSVRWLIVSETVNTNRLTYVGGMSPAAVYCLKDSLPRARFADSVRCVSGMQELAQLSLAGTFDPRREVALPTDEDVRKVATVQSASKGGLEEARIVVDRATEVVIESQSSRGGLLLLADMYYPGWEATVDGKVQPILKANIMHRGVVVPPGVHRVVFAFRSKTVRWGLALTAIGVILLAGIALVLALGGRVKACAKVID